MSSNPRRAATEPLRERESSKICAWRRFCLDVSEKNGERETGRTSDMDGERD